MQCQYCSADKPSVNSLRSHERLCRSNPDRRKSWFELQREAGIRPAFYDDPAYRAKQAANATGQVVTEEKKQVLSQRNKEFYSDPNNKQKQSERMRQAVLDHPESYSKNNVVGRVKNIRYGDRVLKGSWEHLVAQKLDEAGIVWIQPESVPYSWKGRIHRYFPDFYLPDFDLTVEVKGYETERDRAKWSSVSAICIVDLTSIKRLKNGDDIRTILGV